MIQKPFENMTAFNGKSKRSGFKKGLIITSIVFALLSVIFIGIIVFEAFIVVAGVRDNWSEINFAYQHPAIVKVIENDYNKKEQAIEASYGQQKQTAEEQLIQSVTSQFQNASSSSSK